MVYLNINKESNNLALIIGHLYGDGGITAKGRVHYCNSERFLIKEFINSMNEVFNIKPWIKKEVNVIRVVYPVEVGRILWYLFGKFSYGKDTKVITSQIQEMPKGWKATMLKAWFNDDGSVINIPPNYKVIAIHQKLKNLIEFIEETLNEFGIISKIIEDSNKWLLRIHGYENMVKFKDKINFSKGYRKERQLNQMLDSITRPHFTIKRKIVRLLENSPKTLNELCKSLGMSRHLVYGHLYGWKRRTKKSNLGLIHLGLLKCEKDGRVNVYSLTYS